MSINWLLLGIGITAAIILLFRDWRITVTALLLNYVAQAFFLVEQQFISGDLPIFGFAVSTLLVIKLITGISVALILGITALTFSREYGLENLDEFGMAELRRAARAAQRQRANQPFQFGEYVLPFWAGVLALLASLILPRVYAIAPTVASDFVWYWLVLTGILTIATAVDVLKIGLGLLLCVSAVDLLYMAVVSTPDASGLNVIPLALLSLFHLLLALAVAYLSGLLYGRLKTLDLSELYR
ncbi:hypothetical protein [Candidatus Chloroploca sp. Khr17]|uniref:hypothetical protein n=1 Tax=Candidatus Chloroploca sp. Khr17 TaxID=2496869 RepID=UPI00101D9956|nr:hypothetical protein [Candidatus Chloroploca sp. Khr17]